MKITVIGSGIGGLNFALAAIRFGVAKSVSIYERSPGPRLGTKEALGGFQISPNGLRALREACGDATLETVLGYAQRAPGGFCFQGYDGEVISNVVMTEPLSVECVRGGSANLRRCSVLSALLDAIMREGSNVEVVYGKSVVDADPEAGIVRFSNGDASGPFDVIVGADGVHSRVRGSVVSQQPRFTGFLSVGGVYDGPVHAAVNKEKLYFVSGPLGQVGYGCMGHPPGGKKGKQNEWMWWTHLPWPSNNQPSREALEQFPLQSELQRRFLTWATPVCDFVQAAAVNDEQVLRTFIFDVPPLAQWSRGKIVLLGDACHAMSPAGGQGASMALEDGVVLAKALRSLPTLADAFGWYQRQRKIRVEPIVKQGADNDKRGYGAERGPFGMLFTRLALKALARPIGNSLSSIYYHTEQEKKDPLAGPKD